MSSTRQPPVRARPDPRLTARVVRRVAMRYRDGADAALDRPAHVRAASGLAWVGGRLAVIQDDANFVALVDPETGEADAVTLPAGPGGLRRFDDGRGNKDDKLDLEAVTSIEGPDGPFLVALGSGSAPHRECVVVLRGFDGPAVTVTLHRAPAFYARLRAASRFAGSELNVEGALHVGGRLRLFGRGNGAAHDGAEPVDATCEVAWADLLAHLERPESAPPPSPLHVVQYDLGLLDEVRLAFTDAASVRPDGAGARRVVFTAAAEASPDATRDGVVTGSALGVLEEGADGGARWTPLLDVDGTPLRAKVEGLALALDDPRRAFVAVDHDDHDRPSELCEVALTGFGLEAATG
jgi:hypothetical protein